MENNCDACRFWTPNDDTFIDGLCRRFPPSVHIDQTHPPTYKGYPTITMFPTTRGTEISCGEFKRRTQ